MRVGFDARWYNDSGIGTYIAELLRAMVPLLNGVELVVYEAPKDPLPLPAGAGLIRKPVRASRYSLAGQLVLAQCCRRDRLSVFHSPFYIVPVAAACPVVVTIHDLMPFSFPIYSWPKQSLVKLGYRAGLAKAARIISVSENTAQDLRAILHVPGECITSVHNGVQGNVFHTEPREAAEEINYLASKYRVTPPYVVAASTQNWRTKNLKGALAALENAQHLGGTKFQTVVFGPDNGLNASGGRARWKEIRMLAIGRVEHEDLATLFRHAHLFIMPSLYEGFGLPLLEAMACGCAVITSNAGSLAEVAGPGAQVFSPWDIDGMAAAIAELFASPEKLQYWRRAALQRAAEFSWERAAQETLEVYHRVVCAGR